MRLGGRLQGAIEVLEAIESRKVPAADALKDWGASHRFAGSSDRAAIGNIVYDVLRQYASFCWRLDSTKMADISFAALLSDGQMGLAELQKILQQDRFAPKFLSLEKQNAWLQRNLANAPDYIQANIPHWCVSSFQATFAEKWLEEAVALSMRPPFDLRANSLKTTAEKLAQALNKTTAHTINWFAQALRIAPVVGLKRHPNVQSEPSFLQGLFEVQDLGSQIVAFLSGVKPGWNVLDYCAGAGGKTLALSALMNNSGQIHAYDANRARLAPIFDRLRRAGTRNVQPHGRIEELRPLEDQMDMVLVDAPCTGSGTWRRRPDAKWRLTREQLFSRQAEQREVLKKAMRYVKTGGRLVYITCSLFADENDVQIADFLRHTAQFRHVDMKPLWQKIMPLSAPTPAFSAYGIVLSPLATQTDGFYLSILEKHPINK